MTLLIAGCGFVGERAADLLHAAGHTVIGLTQAMGRFGSALRAAGKDVEAITQQLTGVLGGLDTAFITTAEALIAVMAIHILQTLVRRADEQLLDDVRKAAFDAIVTRVRIARQEG